MFPRPICFPRWHDRNYIGSYCLCMWFKWHIQISGSWNCFIEQHKTQSRPNSTRVCRWVPNDLIKKIICIFSFQLYTHLLFWFALSHKQSSRNLRLDLMSSHIHFLNSSLYILKNIVKKWQLIAKLWNCRLQLIENRILGLSINKFVSFEKVCHLGQG